ncbi:MAG TPA: AAA family ATPase [Pirellulales bacterium]|jgi:exonuclease SbcC
MITRIELVNFMSHAHTVIEPAAGLTVLVGPNNVGKSAVVAALQILCHNDNSTYVLRHGQKECSVKIQTDDGHTIEWRRRTSPSYVIDGCTFDRLRNSGSPDELHAALRLRKVDSGGDADFDVHFGSQKSPIFLLASSPANAARFFASSSDAIRLVAMQKRHKDKLSEAQREKTRLEEQSRHFNAELEVLEPIVGLERRLVQLERTSEELLQDDVSISAASKCEAELANQLAAETELAARAMSLASLTAPPALFPTAPLERTTRELTTATRDCDESKSIAGVLAELPAVPHLAPTDGLANLVARLEAAMLKELEADTRVSSLRTLGALPAMHNASGLQELIADIQNISKTIEHSRLQSDLLSQAAAPPAMPDTATLEGICRRLDLCRVSIEALESQLSSCESLTAPPDLAQEQPLRRLIEALSIISQSSNHHERSVAALKTVVLPPVPAATVNLAMHIERIEKTAVYMQSCRADFEAAAADLSTIATELRASAEGKMCPICGNPLDPERLVASAAAGLEGHGHA